MRYDAKKEFGRLILISTGGIRVLRQGTSLYIRLEDVSLMI